MFAKVISIGWGCQVAHQIRRILPAQTEAYFFDWIITDHASLLRAIPMRFDRLLDPDLLVIDPRKICLRDDGTGLYFYGHDFSGPGDGTIGPGYPSEIDEVREKYLRRAERTADLLRSGDPILLIRHGYDNSGAVGLLQRAEIASAFREHYPSANLSFLFTTQLDVDEGKVDEGVILCVAQGADWKGDNLSWDRVFARAGITKTGEA